MSFGFKLTNGAGAIVVDDTFVTLSIVARGDIAVRGGIITVPSGARMYEDEVWGCIVAATFPSPITSISPPLVAFIPGEASGSFHSYQPTGGPGNWVGFTAAYRFSMVGGRTIGSSVPRMHWRYVAARVDMVPRSNEKWGIRVFNEAGAITFDSGVPVMQIVENIRAWQASSVGVRYANREYAHPWKYPFDGRHGFLASSMGSFMVGRSNFGSEWASVRFGFTEPTHLHAAVGGISTIDAKRMAVYGGRASDRLGSLIVGQTGGPQVFAVRVPAL